MKLKLDMSCHLLNAYTKFQIDISKHVEKKSGKLGRTDGRTDGQTDGHCHSIIRPFFKRAYKNDVWVISTNIISVISRVTIINMTLSHCRKYGTFFSFKKLHSCLTLLRALMSNFKNLFIHHYKWCQLKKISTSENEFAIFIFEAYICISCQFILTHALTLNLETNTPFLYVILAHTRAIKWRI